MTPPPLGGGGGQCIANQLSQTLYKVVPVTSDTDPQVGVTPVTLFSPGVLGSPPPPPPAPKGQVAPNTPWGINWKTVHHKRKGRLLAGKTVAPQPFLCIQYIQH